MTTLKASTQGIARIKQARSEKGWAVSDLRWVEEASQVLGTSWEEDGVLALGISEGTWKRFLTEKVPINAQAFKAYCQVLGLDWAEVVEIKDKSRRRKDENNSLHPTLPEGLQYSQTLPDSLLTQPLLRSEALMLMLARSG